MTPIVFAALSLAGGFGALTRLELDRLIGRHTHGDLPWSTAIINISGSLILGFLVGLSNGGAINSVWLAVVGAGFLGGYTTFSTASLETVMLLRRGQWTAGITNALGTVVVATAAAVAGLWLGGLF